MSTRKQMPPKSPTTVEFFVGDSQGLRVTGCYDVAVAVPQRRAPNPRALERIVAKGIKAALREYAKRR